MKHTKRPLSLLLTLCLLLGLLPTTVWASYMVQITQQPTAENNYTVEAKYGANILTEGFQWWKKISVPETYNLVESNPAEDELGVASVYYHEANRRGKKLKVTGPQRIEETEMCESHQLYDNLTTMKENMVWQKSIDESRCSFFEFELIGEYQFKKYFSSEGGKNVQA